jgi:hypothetical protein
VLEVELQLVLLLVLLEELLLELEELELLEEL